MHRGCHNTNIRAVYIPRNVTICVFKMMYICVYSWCDTSECFSYDIVASLLHSAGPRHTYAVTTRMYTVCGPGASECGNIFKIANAYICMYTVMRHHKCTCNEKYFGCAPINYIIHAISALASAFVSSSSLIVGRTSLSTVGDRAFPVAAALGDMVYDADQRLFHKVRYNSTMSCMNSCRP